MAYHLLADDAAAQRKLHESSSPPKAKPPPILLRAAISPHLDPKSLTEAQKATLRNLVAAPEADPWTLRPAERQTIITAAGSLAALKAAHRPQAQPDAAGRALAEILDGPPYRLHDADEEALSWWVQYVKWFACVAPNLPTSNEVSRELERRRLHSRLARICGPDFTGRDEEISSLRRWYRGRTGPLVLTGIGGIGKSALVASFAAGLPPESVLLWLDFDRADLAPDDAISVPSVIADQASVQIDGFERTSIDPSDWQGQARALGRRLAKAQPAPQRPLLVLDSFEAAQYVERYQELWPMLETLTVAMPRLRVCLTGRAGVPGLTLGGKEPFLLHLNGLLAADTRRWLHGKGIRAPGVLDQVVELSGGIPLILRLAQLYIATGGRVADLPRDLPDKIIAGYLYDRILDRVQNPAFKDLAQGLLVLRRVTAEMVAPVLGELVTLPPGEPSEWFAELSREKSLVEGASVLEPRPDVRAATLALLERDNPDFVRAVDQSAAAWYSRMHEIGPQDADELIYHRLRLGDVAGAAKAWRDGCAALLTSAADDLRDEEARAWLLDRLAGASTAAGGSKTGNP